MASPSDSKNLATEDAEVTSEHRNPGPVNGQLLPQEEGKQSVEARELDLEFPLTRQTSIYSLTLDEIQNAVCEPGKTFGSMNMDEFLTNIWNVEEVQAAAAADAADSHLQYGSGGGPGVAQPLRRQGSLTLPAPLSRKTVEEVWAEIHRDAAFRAQQEEQDVYRDDSAGNAHREPTFGEMTLEDFLIKAGVVREGYVPPGAAPSPLPQPIAPPAPPPPPPSAQQYGMAGFGHVVGMAGYVNQHSALTASPAMLGNGGYPLGNGFGARMGNGYGSTRAGSPASPLSSEGIVGQVENTAGGYVGEGAWNGFGGGGRKRPPADRAGADKVVERRQRRMIKNRESAARSRARKQAYTVELEAELNQLKEENAKLREEQTRVTTLRKQLLMEAMAEQALVNARRATSNLRRCNSSGW